MQWSFTSIMGFLSSLSERSILVSNGFSAAGNQGRDGWRWRRACRLNPSSPSLIKVKIYRLVRMINDPDSGARAQ